MHDFKCNIVIKKSDTRFFFFNKKIDTRLIAKQQDKEKHEAEIGITLIANQQDQTMPEWISDLKIDVTDNVAAPAQAPVIKCK